MSIPKKQIGFFGGTFDPFHLGHLNLAVEVLEKKPLDEIWFCPARQSPHKLHEQPTPVNHRLAMVEAAIGNHPHFRLLDIEAKREGPSYTVDTLRSLIEKHPQVQFHLLLGDEAVPGFSHWHRPDEIVRLVPLIVGTRGGHLPEMEGDPLIIQAIRQGYLSTRRMDITATEVRVRLKQGLYCDHLVPKEVLDYIKGHHLYLTAYEN